MICYTLKTNGFEIKKKFNEPIDQTKSFYFLIFPQVKQLRTWHEIKNITTCGNSVAQGLAVKTAFVLKMVKPT